MARFTIVHRLSTSFIWMSSVGLLCIPLNMSTRFPPKIEVLGFRSEFLRKLAIAMATGVGGAGA